ncbi:MAG: nucleotidyl transferase AbiEii/AbiGii toxin family protein [Lentisphaerae bacterium]|nr:nucleotidyl transferase AbiEii/AbiGii toxin family protein [Lentisphaerota bacterium]MBT5607414.1 nucleotidyl transferase AbiEii/AbiGii toxin family protein [Lentisphaerota bacterium]MBT7056122.1 nucleotidyl transferase AbiEii/AbiGii toxin family protein [Lentisphaerota bacterium]MBT7841360.1 nucleotidyl transferase AbiEii/AbiGii toxin family protein [Lentisphaerota bacterium]
MSAENISKSVHQRLLNIRDTTGEQFNHLLLRYGLERLLYRIQAAGHAETFVLKGAMLFALWHDVPGRSTRNIDLLGLGDLTHGRLRAIFADACTAKVEDDGLHFDPTSVKIDDIRDDQEYHGVRVRLLGFLGRARLAIQIDVGLGDAVIPEPREIEYPAILDYPAPRLRAYHPATVVAEKLNATVVLGALNSRMKDFYDMHVILAHMDIEDELLCNAIRATFDRRDVPLPDEVPVAFTPEFLEDDIKETQWRAFLRRSSLSAFGLDLAIVLAGLRKRLWPLLSAARHR